jgi:hypothetical protein
MLRRGFGVALRGVTVHVEPRFTIAPEAAEGHSDTTESRWRNRRRYILPDSTAT